MSIPFEDLVTPTESAVTANINNDKSSTVVIICVGAIVGGLIFAVILLFVIRCINKRRKRRNISISTPTAALGMAKMKGDKLNATKNVPPSSKVPVTSELSSQAANNSGEEAHNTTATIEIKTSPVVSPNVTPNNTSESKVTQEGTITISADYSNRSIRKPRRKKKKKPKPKAADPAALVQRATETLIEFWARKDYMSAEDLAIVKKKYDLSVKHVFDDREFDIFTKSDALKLINDMIAEADRKLTEFGVDYATDTYPQTARIFVDNKATPAFIGIRLLAKEYGDYLGATPDLENLPLSGLFVVVFSEKYDPSIRKTALNQIKTVTQEVLKEPNALELHGPYPWTMLQQAQQRDPAGFSEIATDSPPGRSVLGEAPA